MPLTPADWLDVAGAAVTVLVYAATAAWSVWRERRVRGDE
jgi:hypothetical protein